MAIYTPLSAQQIRSLLAQFPSLPQSPYASRGIAMGTVNTYYKISYKTGDVFYLKIDEVANKKRLENEILIFETLHRAAKHLPFKTPLPLVSVLKKKYVPFEKKFALVIPEVKGKSYFKTDLTPARLKIIGKAVAALHKLKANPKIKTHRFDLKGQENVFRGIETALQKKHLVLATAIRKRLKIFKALQPKREFNGLIHADLFPENILWIKNHLNGLIDFDAAGRGAALFDVGVCLHALCHNGKGFDLKKVRGFLNGYLGKNTKTFDRRSFKFYLDLTAMRFLLTRLRDFELQSGPRKVKPFKDYRDFVRRFAENENLVRSLDQ
jgi:homoserine kinase type II